MTTSFHGLVSNAAPMQEVFEAIRRFGPATEPVLLLGESGTGKEGLARALHAESGRSGDFVALNCGALSPGVVDAELFGHARGAFTGAEGERAGAFEAAHEGTLFLDELGELPMPLQAKLLRVLENRAVRRLGEVRERPVSVRVVSATHRSLEAMVERGEFRADLFHRLCVLDVEIPPLRERPCDVARLARQFLPPDVALGPMALACLLDHTWPGNVRELRNVLTRAVWMARASGLNQDPPLELTPEHLRLRRRNPSGDSAPIERHTLRTVEVSHIREALRQCGGNCAAAARRLGMPRSTFYDRVRRLGLA